MTRDEYDRLTSEFESLGPWPQIRIAPIGASTYRCSFDVSGDLIRVERSDTGRDIYSDFDENLSDQGPFFLSWYMKE